MFDRQKMKEDKGNDTKDRLIQAAGEVFAERGFRAATVREICKRANANPAAINYHIRDKQGLYSAVLQYHHRSGVQKSAEAEVSDNRPAEERLEAFIRSFLLRILDTGRPEWYEKLMMREFSEPSIAFDQIIETSIRPLHNRLALIINELIGTEENEHQIRSCVMSIIGQCLYYHHAKRTISRLYHQNFTLSDIEQLANHITRFSIGGIRNLSGAL